MISDEPEQQPEPEPEDQPPDKPPPEPAPDTPSASDGNDEFPVPLSRFAVSLLGTSDEVWTGVLQANHGYENHKPSEWNAIIDQYKNMPAHPDDPNYDPARYG